jgi:putative spermidine/putrescine transport system ATP-binding protein
MGIGASLSIQHVEKYYKNFRALDNVSFTVDQGTFLTILGPSGSGKTSLLKTIAGFEKIDFGEILLNGENIALKKPYERNIGMLFQNYALFPHMTIFENIAYPLKIRKLPKEEIKKMVASLLELIDLVGVEDRFPKQLSGGQQQRVALARAIVFNPPLLLLDEPLGALDKNLRQKMQLEIKHIQKKVGITTISVTHDQEEALTMSDQVCIMNKGKIEQIGTPENIYQNPRSLFVAEFIGEINLIKGKVIDQDHKCNYVVATDFGDKIKVSMKRNIGFDSEETVHVAVRPENITIIDHNSAAENSITALIKETVFVGDALKVKAELKDGKEIVVKASPSVKESLESGKTIRIGWEGSKCSVLNN